MATLWQSFQTSSMPKRLLQYALSRLELLDAEALDLANLDFALGRNTVLEFRDVGIRTKKLEKLLKLPETFKLAKAKVLQLRVTVPMDFYSSPIVVEVDGVDVRVQVLGADRKPKPPTSKTPEDSTVVPNTVDLAQSFLESEPLPERQKLEHALASESRDLATSVSMSDDGSEDESAFGTGQPLSLPTFLAAFLQGIVDRMEVRIKGVTFQLDMEVPVEAGSSQLGPVSFQIALDSVDVEGVTAASENAADSPTHVPKEGKRHISLNHVRAYLISEANLFSALTRSPSVTSPSVASSPIQTRNPPSRQSSSLSQGSFREQPMAGLQESFREHLSDQDDSSDPEYPLGDSEEALGIPYDLSEPEAEDVDEEDSPATPRASVYHEFQPTLEDSLFHSTMSSEPLGTHSIMSDGQLGGDLMEFSASESLPGSSVGQLGQSSPAPDADLDQTSSRMTNSSTLLGNMFMGSSNEGLAESHIYTHEEAESMYLSAFSQTSPLAISNRIGPNAPETESSSPEVLPQASLSVEASTTMEQPPSPPSQPQPEIQTETQPSEPSMPGGWNYDDDSDESNPDETQFANMADPPTNVADEQRTTSSEATTDGLAADASRLPVNPEVESELAEGADRSPQLDDSDTPKGPTRLVKEILHLDNISIYVPSQHQHVQVETTLPDSVAHLSQSLARSAYPQAPGAFSIQSPISRPHEPLGPGVKDDPNANATEVILSPTKIAFDASLAFLLAMVTGKLMEAVKEGYSPGTAQEQNAGKTENTQQSPQLHICWADVSINFINRLAGVTDTPERFLDPSTFMFDHEVLLNATLKDLSVSLSPTTIKPASTDRDQSPKGSGLLTNIKLRKFRFGYANGDIISFDNAKPMSTSIRDTFLSEGYDIGVKIIQTANAIRTDVETLPCVIQIDLQRLDETFSWFGGLSSFLNMSASVTSSQSPILKSTPLPPAKPRGVHFEPPSETPAQSATSGNKVNVRLGGALVELVGKDCSVAAETSAIKIVNRPEGTAVACSKLRISGPYLHNSLADPAISTEIGGVRLEFLTTPKDTDLETLLELIIPSKIKFDQGNDEIMVDTLLRQRRKGSVLRASVDTMNIMVKNMSQLATIPALGEEVAKLAGVAKYLPEDDRPGLLTLGSIQKVGISLDFGGPLGHLGVEARKLNIGHITMPALVAIALHGLSVKRNHSEELVSTTHLSAVENANRNPVIMARMIGDEIEPVIKLKLHDLMFDYRVPTVMDILGLAEDATPQDFEAGLAASVASLGDQAHVALARPPPSPTEKAKPKKPVTLNIGFQDCLLGLNPLNLPSKLAIALTEALLEVVLPEDVETKATLNINKASVLLIDDVGQTTTDRLGGSRGRRSSSTTTSRQVADMCALGYVDICYISSAKAVVDVKPGMEGEKQIEVELRDDLLVLETCADSMQTLITLANALSPPTPPSKENKYRTNVVPVEDLLASISAEAFGKPEGEYDFDQDFAGAQEMAGSLSSAEDGSDTSLRVDSEFYGNQGDAEELFDATKASVTSHGTLMEDTNEGVLLTGFNPSSSRASEDSDDLVIHEDFYDRRAEKSGAAKIWNSNKNTYDAAPEKLVKRSPLRVSVRDVHFIWNLFDGYDWAHTREVINKAVHDVEAKAYERQSRLGGQQVYEEELEDEETIGDFLFNSIYIGIPANRDPGDLARAINEGLNDNATETESIATTAITATTNRTSRPHQPKSKRLRLNRSKHHKITFELRGVNVDMVAFPPGAGETMSSIDVRVHTLDIFDHVPTSTWKKFATYDQDQGERELGTSMVHLEILNVKPLPELGASEIVLRATILPLRLHVDQDALDFITRFFEFKDDKVPVHASPSDVPFVQRAEINNVPVKLDFKPKRVDYGGLRSGHTTEFMNFIVLEESRMVLRHVIIYGVSGFDRLGKTLNDIWMPDVKNNQLPGVIAGLAPVRSLVNIGSGFRDLIEIPVKEYQKDGRVIRSIQKGAAAFARTTGTEIVKLGAKLAVGTQYALQGAEGMLSEQHQPDGSWEDDDLEPEEKKQISLYADQPTGVIQGIRGGYRSLTRDVNLARDAIIAIPGEVIQSQSAAGAAKAVWKRAPTIIFRPAVGVTKVIGQTLMGATNTIDPNNRRRIDEKYKKH
ncbi:Autophagy-related protein [Paramyrothecium foliicola]|nr:Autophagy-related protein [Paramyrothecium foliicola]